MFGIYKLFARSLEDHLDASRSIREELEGRLEESRRVREALEGRVTEEDAKAVFLHFTQEQLNSQVPHFPLAHNTPFRLAFRLALPCFALPFLLNCLEFTQPCLVFCLTSFFASHRLPSCFASFCDSPRPSFASH